MELMDIAAVRADFPALEREVNGCPLVYLDNAATAHKPQAVLDRVVDHYRRSNSGVHRGVHALSEEASEAYESARKRVGVFLGGALPAEVVFTRGATESINLVASSFGEAFVGSGDEILVTEMEHHSNLVPWQRLCERAGARLRVLPVDDRGALCLDALDALLGDRTRLLALTHVSNVTGLVNPLAELISLAHARDIPVLVDGAQAAPHLKIDVRALDCDFYVFSGHKVYAETGIGVLYGKQRWLDAMPPYQSGGGMVAEVDLDGARFAALPLKFEAGTGNIAGAVSLAAALDYLTEVGLSAVAAHESALLGRLEAGLRERDGVLVHGGRALRCGSLAFNVAGTHPADVGMVLDKMGIAVRTGTLCAEPLVRRLVPQGTIRASVALYNTDDEIDALLVGLDRATAMLRG